LAVNGLKGTIW